MELVASKLFIGHTEDGISRGRGSIRVFVLEDLSDCLHGLRGCVFSRELV